MSLMWFSEWVELNKKRKAKEKKNERSNSQAGQQNWAIGDKGQADRNDSKVYTADVYDFTQPKWQNYSGRD